MSWLNFYTNCILPLPDSLVERQVFLWRCIFARLSSTNDTRKVWNCLRALHLNLPCSDPRYRDAIIHTVFSVRYDGLFPPTWCIPSCNPVRFYRPLYFLAVLITTLFSQVRDRTRYLADIAVVLTTENFMVWCVFLFLARVEKKMREKGKTGSEVLLREMRVHTTYTYTESSENRPCHAILDFVATCRDKEFRYKHRVMLFSFYDSRYIQTWYLPSYNVEFQRRLKILKQDLLYSTVNNI